LYNFAEPLISVIIPCFNAQDYIGNTIQSVLNQSFQDFEIIIVNDGSSDRTEEQIKRFSDPRIFYIKKSNTGVSDTRNRGLELANGDFVLFLDADDLLGKTFLEKRLELLMKTPEAVFSCGKVIKVNEQGITLPGDFQGTTEEIYRDVLLYNPQIITCPSNYLYRTDFLKKQNLTFNISLSSTADRFFLIELAKYGKGVYVKEGGELYYQVRKTSMSHQFSLFLVKDTEVFYRALQSKRNYIPKDVYKMFLFKINYILGASYITLKLYKKGLFYIANSFSYSPIDFVNKVFHKILLSSKN